jgi:hypothetical protein
MAIDYETLFGGDDYDPCLIARTLRPTLMQLIVEGQVQTVKFRDREVRYGVREIDELRGLVEQMESECRIKNGDTSGIRKAITAGQVHCD